MISDSRTEVTEESQPSLVPSCLRTLFNLCPLSSIVSCTWDKVTWPRIISWTEQCNSVLRMNSIVCPHEMYLHFWSLKDYYPHLHESQHSCSRSHLHWLYHTVHGICLEYFLSDDTKEIEAFRIWQWWNEKVDWKCIAHTDSMKMQALWISERTDYIWLHTETG